MDKRSLVRSTGAFLSNKWLRKTPVMLTVSPLPQHWQVRNLALAERNASEMSYHSVTRSTEDEKHPRSPLNILRKLSQSWRIKNCPFGLRHLDEELAISADMSPRLCCDPRPTLSTRYVPSPSGKEASVTKACPVKPALF